jgi:spoIIIJ-associated protein
VVAMARTVERHGATVEEALEAALAELGVSEQEARVEVLQEPKGGFLGVGAQEAHVRVTAEGASALEVSADDAEPRSAEGDDADLKDLEEQADAVADFLEQLLGKMDVDAIAEPNPVAGQMYVDILDGPEDDMALLIGRHGQTLEAIQELTRMIVGSRLEERIRVIVDVEDYRKRRIALIQDHAREVGERVLRTGREEEFEPMNPFERKLVHDAVAEVGGGLETSSRGEEPQRYVVVRRP